MNQDLIDNVTEQLHSEGVLAVDFENSLALSYDVSEGAWIANEFTVDKGGMVQIDAVPRFMFSAINKM